VRLRVSISSNREP